MRYFYSCIGSGSSAIDFGSDSDVGIVLPEPWKFVSECGDELAFFCVLTFPRAVSVRAIEITSPF